MVIYFILSCQYGFVVTDFKNVCHLYFLLSVLLLVIFGREPFQLIDSESILYLSHEHTHTSARIAIYTFFEREIDEEKEEKNRPLNTKIEWIFFFVFWGEFMTVSVLLSILNVLILWCWHIGSMKLNVNMCLLHGFFCTLRYFASSFLWLFSLYLCRTSVVLFQHNFNSRSSFVEQNAPHYIFSIQSDRKCTVFFHSFQKETKLNSLVNAKFRLNH